MLTEQDLHLFNEGTHERIYEAFGAQRQADGSVHFAVWAPEAAAVNLVGDFNAWDPAAHPMRRIGETGVWACEVAEAGVGDFYKYQIHSHHHAGPLHKADPVAAAAQLPPGSASRIADLDYEWGDAEWMRSRHRTQALGRPMSMYEVHLGSWRRDDGRMLGYREVAEPLAGYVRQLGFTHVELMPLAEHPFYGSWGYQSTGYFAPTSRYGDPVDLMYLIDVLHQHGIGVVLDWVPSHFPMDAHGLFRFDGSALYEHLDPREGYHPDWKSAVFNYGRHEVRSFLISSAMSWLDRYHVDALRVDAVASMLYRDYSRKEGEWIPNRHGGRENLEAVDFLRDLNRRVYRAFPDVHVIAEESTAWPAVTRPVHDGGLGFGLKWDMGWMHDTLEYFRLDPVFRADHHGKITFRTMYAWSENFLLPLSHDEVVHGKGSLLGKMHGNVAQRFASLRLLLATMYAQPGKKLLFMGSEIGQWREWNHDAELSWYLLDQPRHRGLQLWVEALNGLYRAEPAMYEGDVDPRGFLWVHVHDAELSVFSFLRLSTSGQRPLVVVLNATPVPRSGYPVGLPEAGPWRVILDSHEPRFRGVGGESADSDPPAETALRGEPQPLYGQPFSTRLQLAPLSAVFLAPDREA